MKSVLTRDSNWGSTGKEKLQIRGRGPAHGGGEVGAGGERGFHNENYQNSVILLFPDIKTTDGQRCYQFVPLFLKCKLLEGGISLVSPSPRRRDSVIRGASV